MHLRCRPCQICRRQKPALPSKKQLSVSRGTIDAPAPPTMLPGLEGSQAHVREALERYAVVEPLVVIVSMPQGHWTLTFDVK